MRCNQARNIFTSINFKCQSEQTSYNSIQCFGRKHFHMYHDGQHSWSVLSNIHKKDLKSENKKYACLMLNLSEKSNKLFDRYRYMWDESNFRVAVDGSANFLAKNRMIHTADVVCGDFDSIDSTLLEQLRCPNIAKARPHWLRLQKNGLPILPQVIEAPCQRDTDFTKAIRITGAKRQDISFFFAMYHPDGSRMDHLFSLINTLHIIRRNLILVNIRSNTISWLLYQGRNIIHKPLGRELCSLVPFTGLTEVRTEGLFYDMGPGYQLNFGGTISTSNVCAENSEKVTIDTSKDILWSIDVCV